MGRVCFCFYFQVIVMSATLQADQFSAFFDGAKVLYVQGRQHPVDVSAHFVCLSVCLSVHSPVFCCSVLSL